MPYIDGVRMRNPQITSNAEANETKKNRVGVYVTELTSSYAEPLHRPYQTNNTKVDSPQESTLVPKLKRDKLKAGIDSLHFHIQQAFGHEHETTEILEIQKQDAMDAGVFGIAIDPRYINNFRTKVKFDGIGRVIGLVKPLTDDRINKLRSHEVMSPTQTNSTSNRDAAKTESECIIEFIYKLSQIDNTEAGTNDIKSLIGEAKMLWISGDLSKNNVANFFTKAVESLSGYPKLQELANTLLSETKKDKATSQYIDNLFPRHFDSKIASHLVKAPTKQAINTSIQIGSFLVNEFDTWIREQNPAAAASNQLGRTIEETLSHFADVMYHNYRPWFQKDPTILAFLRDPSYDNFKSMMTQVNDGIGMIKIPFIAVKMATQGQFGMGLSPWKIAANIDYNAILKTRTPNQDISSGKESGIEVTLQAKRTEAPGIGLHFQPKIDTHDLPDELIGGISVTDNVRLHQEEITEFEKNALEHGHTVVSGTSGSTNIMVHLFQYIKKHHSEFSVEQGFLNTLAFLVYDGGHSVNESIAVYKALQQKRSPEEDMVINTDVVNYQDLIDIADKSAKGTMFATLMNAFNDTMQFYKQNAYSASNNK